MNVYKIKNNLVTIYFTHTYYTSINHLPRHDLLCYLDCVGFRGYHLTKMINNHGKLHCPFCQTFPGGQFYEVKIGIEKFNVCWTCKQKECNKLYINKIHKVIGRQVHKIENRHGKTFHYKIKCKLEDFNFINIITSGWWIKACLCSKPCTKFNVCNECYHFSYDLLFKTQLCKYYLLESIILVDLSRLIFNQLLSLLGFNEITFKLHKQLPNSVIPAEQVIHAPNSVIQSIESDSESDWITEDNLDFYINRDDIDY